MWLEAVSASSDDAETCPTCGSGVQRRTYGALHAGTFILNGERVEICREPIAGFSNPVVLDLLVQYFDGHLYRIWPTDRYFSRGGARLHREVWRRAFGPIPPGCHIHHRDGNATNNQLGNLECLPAREHALVPRPARNGPHFTAAARTAAAQWHQSEAGRLWHGRMAKRAQSWTKWTRVDRACEACGTVVSMLVRKSGHAQKFCSETCKSLAYRRRQRAPLPR